jgi:hypothetical protein
MPQDSHMWEAGHRATLPPVTVSGRRKLVSELAALIGIGAAVAVAGVVLFFATVIAIIH